MKNFVKFALLYSFILFGALSADQEENDPEFIKGYLFSKIEDRYPGEKIEFDIQEHNIIVYEFPNDPQLCENLKVYLQSIPDYAVVFDETYEPACVEDVNTSRNAPAEEGDFLPEMSPFFPTLLAQPHIVGYSAGYRSYDKVFRLSCLPVSIGDEFSLYQFKTKFYGRLYFGIEACVWAIFEARAKSLSLINADYYIALPLTYIQDKFAARLRVYHESSHLGDEFLIEHPRITRFNPSMEVLDLSLAYDFADRLTTFVGASRVLRSDDGYRIKPNGFFYGFNYVFDLLKIRVCNLDAEPYAAVYFSNWQDNHWRLDSTVTLGYQWEKTYGHKLRIYLEGHDGYSPDGQFSKQRTRFVALKLSYGY